ncbi:hypothetical protein BC938DRAFT_479373 [Jimgerdemannia flammicorona]|uniref:Peptidase C14 caspase domain-containing protein n=1 Tax=Jimgerdemannia flammicorona TaxID=994334 RepID=A0A433QKZ3_9FUNG|nr:hypothetical protein BC938DRAFT_479373 [Jimgerdemannia flammicorona]
MLDSNIFEQGYALLIGTGVNASGQLHPAYNSTINDANWLGGILKDPARCAYKPEQVVTLTGADATRTNILREMDKISRAANEDSTVVIFFSGHSKRDDKEKSVLIPFGYEDGQDPAEFTIDSKRLCDSLAAMDVKRLVLLLNCCYATDVVITISSETEDELGLRNIPLSEAQMRKLSKGTGLVVMSSSLVSENSHTGYLEGNEPKNIYSAFTVGVGNALSGIGQRGDGLVHITDLASQCHKFVVDKTNNRQHTYFKLYCDDFPIAYYHGGLYSIAAVVGDNFTEEPDVADETTTIGVGANNISQPTMVFSGNIHVENGSLFVGCTFGDGAFFEYAQNT